MLYPSVVSEDTHCFSTIPTGLWRDHSDPEVRGFYSLLNTRSRKFAEAFG